MDREDVAHRLRTPLTTIKGVLKMVTAGRLAERAPHDAQDLLQRAEQQVVNLERVIEDVEAHFRPCDLEEATVLEIETGDPPLFSFGYTGADEPLFRWVIPATPS